jgi:hypothetical protein
MSSEQFSPVSWQAQDEMMMIAVLY